MKEAKTRKNQIAFVVLLLVVILCSCVLVGTFLAWLKDDDGVDSNGQIHLGEVGFAVYHDNVLVTSGQEIAVNGNNAIRNVNLKVRNTGTVSGLIRVTISIYYKDASGNNVPFIIVESPSALGQATFSATNWVYRMSGGEDNTDINLGGGMTAGQMFYNAKIEPYINKSLVDNGDGTTSVVEREVTANAVSIVSQILLSNAQASETIYMLVTVDGVAQSGNIYKKIEAGQTTSADIPVEAYPFGTPESLPEIWTAPYL